MSIGPLAFLNPWLLAALALLPVIWLLLRFTPPRPTKLTFPPTWLLRGLEDRERTPARSPWWLTLMRVAMAALVIAALARPVINPDVTAKDSGGPLVIVVDNGWGAASRWTSRESALRDLFQTAERGGRTIHLLPTAGPLEANALEPLTAGTALGRIATLQPMPYRPDRLAALDRLKSGLKAGASPQVVWLSDGLDYGQSKAFADGLIALAGDGEVTILQDEGAERPLASYAMTGEGGALKARVLSTGEASRSGIVDALSARGDRLLSIPFTIDAGTTSMDLPVGLPRELRNQVARLTIRGEPSAGAVYLLDKRSVRRSVALISGTAREQAQPLLSPLYYVERALKPYADVAVTQESNLAAAVDELLEQKPSMLVLADIGKLVGSARQRIESFVSDGGTLLRFAGPRLEAGTDGLLPVRLRQGERTLGGSLSWSEPQSIGPFESGSPFIGLAPPKDIAINRQVLADPSLSADAEIWARLADGTPLVTAARRGQGRIILFHVTANPDWSNLPLSGLFVEMLQRLSELSMTTAAAGDAGSTANPAANTKLLSPLSVLDGYGRLVAPGPRTDALTRAKLADIAPGPNRPPGYYGPSGAAFALNITTRSARLKPQDGLPAGIVKARYHTGEAMELRPWLLLGALMIFIADMLVVIAMSSGLMLRRAAAPALLIAALIALSPTPGLAQSAADASGERKVTGYEAALETRLAFVLSGDEEVDRVSRAGLRGLSLVLRARTAVEPGATVGVDITKDELAFYPLLYWPIVPEAEDLTDETLAKIDAYMKQGGMIIFDTRDYQRSITTGAGRDGPGLLALRRILGSLDLPKLEPVRDGHVLTKSFYLLRSFPGRWDGGELWAEAQPTTEDEQARRARSADGVSSVLITANDLAAAWALDISNRPLFPAVPGGEVQRELAFRTGINIVMYALTGNYKADQVHLPALLERMGQ